MKCSVAVIIPAYNESQNLATLLPKIYKVLPCAKVIIVDDSCRQSEIKSLKSKVSFFRKRVVLISRQRKLGRGSAVLTGFREALKDKSIKYFFEMDADLAHNPSEYPRFLAVNADLIVGSRYLKQSLITKWPFYRLMLSRMINLFLNLWLGLSLSDYTNGFRLYSRRAVEYLLTQRLRQPGFISLSETAFKLHRANFKIVEIPITFCDRVNGKSNAGVRELIRSFFGAIEIRFS